MYLWKVFLDELEISTDTKGFIPQDGHSEAINLVCVQFFPNFVHKTALKTPLNLYFTKQKMNSLISRNLIESYFSRAQSIFDEKNFL